MEAPRFDPTLMEREVRDLLDALDRMGGGPLLSPNVDLAIRTLRVRYPRADFTAIGDRGKKAVA